MLGVSLPVNWLLNDCEDMPCKDLLEQLKRKNVRSIELRTVRAHHKAEEIHAIARMLWKKGFLISIHGAANSVETAVEDVFLPLQNLLSKPCQKSITVTIHPQIGDNGKMLTALADHISANSLPVKIALENNRLLPGGAEGDCAEYVFGIVKKLHRPEVGICFDFGHYIYYRTKNRPTEPELLPSEEFFREVIHTHIHGLSGLKTHFPLNGENMPLKEIFQKLACGYFGICNLELDFPRFDIDPKDALMTSLDVLEENLNVCTRLYDRVRDDFDRCFLDSLKLFEKEGKGTHFSLLQSASYLFQTNGYSWGMDLAFRNTRFLAETPSQGASLLKDLKLFVVSHSHEDHFEDDTIKMLSSMDMEWVIPDFMYDLAVERGISPDKIHVAKEGVSLQVGPLTILPFKGRHFRPGTGKGVPEYGYFVTAPDAPSMVFPVDARDFSLEHLPKLPKADYCFANVWLGDEKGLDDEYASMEDVFARFMLEFSTENVMLTHLYETGRKDVDMWRDCHGQLIRSRIKEISPDTTVLIPQWGEIIRL